MIKNTSIYTLPCRLFRGIFPTELIKPRGSKEKKRFNEFWRVKYKKTLEAEKSRVIIDNREYLITSSEGFLAEINKNLEA